MLLLEVFLVLTHSRTMENGCILNWIKNPHIQYAGIANPGELWETDREGLEAIVKMLTV